MIKFIEKFEIKRFKKKFQKLIDNNNVPQNANDWKVRAALCKALIKDIDGIESNKYKIFALEEIYIESIEMFKKLEAHELYIYLSGFSSQIGFDKYKQIGGRKFADEFIFYKNKSQIDVFKNGNVLKFFILGGSSFLSHFYRCNYDDFKYEIYLGDKSPEEIQISIEIGDSHEIFIVNLQS